jgi:hypothetical protein
MSRGEEWPWQRLAAAIVLRAVRDSSVDVPILCRTRTAQRREREAARQFLTDAGVRDMLEPLAIPDAVWLGPDA